MLLELHATRQHCKEAESRENIDYCKWNVLPAIICKDVPSFSSHFGRWVVIMTVREAMASLGCDFTWTLWLVGLSFIIQCLLKNKMPIPLHSPKDIPHDKGQVFQGSIILLRINSFALLKMMCMNDTRLPLD